VSIREGVQKRVLLALLIDDNIGYSILFLAIKGKLLGSWILTSFCRNKFAKRICIEKENTGIWDL